MTLKKNHKYRILAVDDEIEILESIQNTLQPSDENNPIKELYLKAHEIYNDAPAYDNSSPYELTTCQQGDKAVEIVKKSLEEGKPFALAFVDIRIPPGPDGVWTARQLHDLDPAMNIVIITAFSDVSPSVISKHFTTPARLFYIQKPFHSDEIRQLADALSENWEISRKLAHDSDYLQELVENQIDKLTQEEHERRETEKKLESQTKHVEDVNTALRVILNEKEWERKRYEENLTFNFKQNIAPYLLKLKKTNLTAEQKKIVTAIEDNLKYMKDSLSSESVSKRLKLSPVELQVANLIKNGKASKEIADILSLSPLTVESYRKTIRKKIGLTHSKENLRTWLLEYM